MNQIFLLPNIITISRIFLIIPSLYCLDNGMFLTSFFLVSILFLTDFFDGYLARKFQMTSYLGSILDPIADKIVVISFFTYLFLINKVFLFYYLLILVRDISQLLSIPVLLLWKKIQFKVKPKLIPKWGTALNFVILGIITISLVIPNFDSIESYIYILYGVYILSSCIELYVLITYIPRFIQIYRGNHDTFE
jgi:phosphatidylglycerophosphate synthase